MSELTKTMKLHLNNIPDEGVAFSEVTARYSVACDYVSRYIFDNSCDNGFELNFMTLQDKIYGDIRTKFDLKSQMAISCIKTVTARYKTVKEQLSQNPYRYKDENDKTCYIHRTLEWLQKPIHFSRPQADLVRNRDYSFTSDGMISINTLGKRIKTGYDVPECFKEYFEDSAWSFGTAKLVSLKGEWYLHIPVTKTIPDVEEASPKHVVGIDRGLRFLTTSYDENGKVSFSGGRDITARRERILNTRAELQSKGTKSAKRALKRISGRENRWITDVNHQLSKTLVNEYGADTLFVLEDLTGVSFSEDLLSDRSANGRYQLRSWPFYQFEQFLTYKAKAAGSNVIKVNKDYTSQRCPKCGRIHKENRDKVNHEYVCDACGYRSNDDRIAAMNLYLLGTMYVSGDTNPRFGVRKLPNGTNEQQN